MRKKIISLVLVISMLIGTTACSKAGRTAEKMVGSDGQALALAAENPVTGTNVVSQESSGTSANNLAYNSIGAILASKSASDTQTAQEPGELYDASSIGYAVIVSILKDKLGADDVQITSRANGLSGFDRFTDPASYNFTGDPILPGSEDASIDDEEEDPDSPTLDLSEINLDEVEFLSLYQKGVSDPTVAIIQQRLMDLGFMDYAEPTEYYGSVTMQAVKRFQRQNDLKQDGVIGSESIAMLISQDAKSYLVKKGMEGSDIKTIQSRLYELGYLSSKSLITGSFGDETEKAVQALQIANNLSADGKIGTMTLELLYSEEVLANILSFGDRSDIVKACQERLKKLGYLTTNPDGYYGNDTLAAVKLFQSKNDLIVDGYLGPTTREVLDSSSAVANGLVLGDEGDTVKRVQELLIKYGYMSEGGATGYFGEVTEKAVKAFQKANGLLADGDVGSKTMAKLTGGDVVRAGETGHRDEKKEDKEDKEDTDTDDDDSGYTYSGSVKNLIKVAKSKLGCKYVYGAKGPNKFDCSGFVYWCLNQVGVKQSYVTSYGWRTIGKYKKISNYSSLKAGDIIVVYGHVGIIAENGTVIDASSSQGKIVHRSLSSWWKSRFVCGWRIFD